MDQYFPESKTLDCLAPVRNLRKVVRPWVFRALDEGLAGVSTEGAELIYDPISTGIYLRETFAQGPVRKNAFKTSGVCLHLELPLEVVESSG